MNKRIHVELPFIAPVGLPGVLRLQHECGNTALLSLEFGGVRAAPIASASLTTTDLHQLVDGLMDAIYAIERQERL